MRHMASALLRLVSPGTGSPSPVVAVAEGLGFGLARAGRSRVTMPSEFV